MIDGETGGDDAFFSFGVFNWYELSTSFFVEFGCFIVIVVVVVVVVVVSVRLRTCPVFAGFCFLRLENPAMVVSFTVFSFFAFSKLSFFFLSSSNRFSSSRFASSISSFSFCLSFSSASNSRSRNRFRDPNLSRLFPKRSTVDRRRRVCVETLACGLSYSFLLVVVAFSCSFRLK